MTTNEVRDFVVREKEITSQRIKKIQEARSAQHNFGVLYSLVKERYSDNIPPEIMEIVRLEAGIWSTRNFPGTGNYIK